MTLTTIAAGDVKPRLEKDDHDKWSLDIGDDTMPLSFSEYAFLHPVVEKGELDLKASGDIYGKDIKERHADVIAHNIRRKMDKAHPDWVLVGITPRYSNANRPLQLRRRADIEPAPVPGPGLYSSTAQDGLLQLVYEGDVAQVAPIVLLVVAAALFGKRLSKQNFGEVAEQYLGAAYEGRALKIHVSHANSVLMRLGVPLHLAVCREHGAKGTKNNFYAGLPGHFTPNKGKRPTLLVDKEYACG